MADIASVALPKELLGAVTFTATAVAGDLITGLSSSANTILLFKNDHVSAVTVTVANVTAADVEVPTYGRVQKADAVLAVAAGDVAALSIPSNQLAQYLSASKIAMTYTGHNVAFKVAALRTA
jgi:hypothetical protein